MKFWKLYPKTCRVINATTSTMDSGDTGSTNFLPFEEWRLPTQHPGPPQLYNWVVPCSELKYIFEHL